MIRYLNLKKINYQYQPLLMNAVEKVISSGYYIRGEELKLFEADFARIWLIKQGDICHDGCIHAQVREGRFVDITFFVQLNRNFVDHPVTTAFPDDRFN